MTSVSLRGTRSSDGEADRAGGVALAGAVRMAEVLARHEWWRGLPAVRAGRVHEVPGTWISTVSHHAAQGLNRVARLLHPEAF